MFVSNAERWAKLCHQQAELIESLSESFPERRDNHINLGLSWRQLEEQISKGRSLKLRDIK
ncbi:hypothetical protein [Shewanella woodyi]|uniref:hypothetical protein n=1 Tax=Shewanella woodyi TaxID=60961 RepID=UPI00374A5B17